MCKYEIEVAEAAEFVEGMTYAELKGEYLKMARTEIQQHYEIARLESDLEEIGNFMSRYPDVEEAYSNMVFDQITKAQQAAAFN
ncbi:hypothetical protein QP938_08650 [Porticoccaceae bacterium LTM1]|nr:hypothetical protein QP938_08650 [Porticoccaceae bacterium LTM1]